MGTRPRHTYLASGVDADAAERLVAGLGPAAAATARAGSDARLGGFGAVFDLAREGFRDPVLVAAADGVGTKLLLAAAADRHEGIGVDLVAMSVNDVLVQGAEPLFFLDYLAVGRLDAARASRVLGGVAEGCREAGCALVGGETAELPGLYRDGYYDLAGFAVGAAERGALLPRDVVAGDRVLALASDGLHANGFSLVRAVLGSAGTDLAAPAPFEPDVPLAEALLRPTRIYVRALLPFVREGRIRALAHVTGGGLAGNLARVLPEGLGADIDGASLRPQPVFGWLRGAGGIGAEEMLRTFNCGVGMAAVCAPGDAEALAIDLEAAGETAWPVGTVVARDAGQPVRVDDAGAPWRG